MSSFPKYVRVRQVSLKIKKFTEERFFVNKKSVDLMSFGFFHDEHTKNRGFKSLPTPLNYYKSNNNKIIGMSIWRL